MVIPSLMLIMGKSFIRVRPKNKRSKIYYRTERSMRDVNTKRFAHQVCGKFYLWAGKWCALLSGVVAVIFLRFSVIQFETACGICLLLETLLLLFAVPLTEKALAHRFGQDFV